MEPGEEEEEEEGEARAGVAAAAKEEEEKEEVNRSAIGSTLTPVPVTTWASLDHASLR